MKLESYIQEIQKHLIQTHQEIITWFEESEVIRLYRPEDAGWTINEILEHIALTSHYLLILIDKGADKALRNIQGQSIEQLLKTEKLSLDKIERIGMHKSFDWIRPKHMEPTGQKTKHEVIDQLNEQLNRCLKHLNKLKNGEGLRYKTTMSVDGLGKIHVYEYILFLSKHAERHIGQMDENKREYLQTVQ